VPGSSSALPNPAVSRSGSDPFIPTKATDRLSIGNPRGDGTVKTWRMVPNGDTKPISGDWLRFLECSAAGAIGSNWLTMDASLPANSGNSQYQPFSASPPQLLSQ
jgi:hypothetical protein